MWATKDLGFQQSIPTNATGAQKQGNQDASNSVQTEYSNLKKAKQLLPFPLNAAANVQPLAARPAHPSVTPEQ